MKKRLRILAVADGGEVTVTLIRYEGRKKTQEREIEARIDDEGDVTI